MIEENITTKDNGVDKPGRQLRTLVEATEPDKIKNKQFSIRKVNSKILNERAPRVAKVPERSIEKRMTPNTQANLRKRSVTLQPIKRVRPPLPRQLTAIVPNKPEPRPKPKHATTVKPKSTSVLPCPKPQPSTEDIKVKDDEDSTPAFSIIKRNITNIGNTGLRSHGYISGVDEWIKKNRLEPGTKVFVISAGYPEIRKALEDRGWIQNPDFESTCYHLKYSLRSKDIDYGSLSDNQIANHFGKANGLTTKAGICKTLKNSVWACAEDEDSYFPKCFETHDREEYEAFLQYYKILRAESILRKLVALGDTGQRDSLEYARLIDTQAEVAVRVVERRLVDLDDMIDMPDFQDITDAEWQVIMQGEKTKEDVQNIIRNQNAKRYEKMLKKKKKKKKKAKKIGEDMEEEGDGEEGEEAQRPDIEIKIIDILKALEAKYPQAVLTGADNIWIVKPSGLSRGRGIRLYNSLEEINFHLKSKDSCWIIQKYIENPFLYQGRKLDMRQWVMVTDWNPLTVWFYDECYVRLSSSQYCKDNLKNRFSHLTNTIVNKRSSNFTEEDCLLSQDSFAEYLASIHGGDPFYQKIQPAMKSIVKNAMLCVQDMVDNRKNSNEIYGFDFCIDDSMKLWLIEVNSSPAWDTTSVHAM